MFGPALKRPPPMPSTTSVHWPAPMGGLNTVDAGTDMPPTDCVFQYNLVADSHGLSSRLGWKEWATTLGGPVLTTVPFAGTRKNNSTDKLFGATATGLWDVSASTTSPSRTVTFGVTSGDAGYGVSTVATTPAGRYLVHCDEENGLYLYSETSTSWVHVPLGAAVLWAPSVAYLVGDKVQNGPNVYVCTTAGTSTGTGPTGTGTAIADGTAVWDYVSAKVANCIGPSLADARAGFSGDPAKFAFVTVWKNRLWFVEKDSTRGWYLAINAVFGPATSFDFGSKMRAGGPLVGLYNWSYDGGRGLDTLLVGISSAGDIVIYTGTDPSSADTFGLKGCWTVGGVPSGRRIATDYGGDLLVLSLLGIIPLSKLVLGNSELDRTQYATAKVSNLFGRIAAARASLPGWGLYIHPTDNALVVTVPTQAGQPTEQFVMSLVTGAWGRYRDLPIFSAGVWGRKLYFGTTDGRVCVNDGGVDGVLLSNPNAYTPITWAVLGGFQNNGNARQKRVQMIRPTILAASSNPRVKASARYNFDVSDPTAIGAAGAAGGSTWGHALWGVSKWGGGQAANQALTGATGMGREVAILVQGVSTDRMTLVGVDVMFDMGGLL